jgi:Leucine-rich repeat (LRR) protein
LSDLTELKILNCGKNKLVELDLRNNNELEDLVCHKNKLTSIQLPNNPEELTRLFLNKNNFSTQTLDFLKNCTNLTVLRLDNNDEIGLIENKEEEIDEEIYNRFYGSLEPLKNMF